MPRLSAAPAAFAVGAGKSRTATVTLTASAAGKPGVHYARLAVRTSTPYPAEPVTVTLTVLPPASP
ncbi:hypothetical protein [Dactylosporangium sp. NPDC050588]|uniref:hypothetical protein n=1 Tax=Dactylosporangium sp. NPDC050588 TaxID=3157211 RepID=UPI00340ACFA8